VLAGRSGDSRTVQVLIANYQFPPPAAPSPRMRFLSLEPRTGIVYQNNAGYDLKVIHLPWGKDDFTVKRYRTTNSENWLESESSGRGGTLELSNPLPPPGIELISIERKQSAGRTP